MNTRKHIALFATALMAVSATSALAGSKYSANIVPSSTVHPPANPTLSSKGKIQASDKGVISIQLAGVTDGAGILVTTSQVYNLSVKTPPIDLDGSEYTAIVKIKMPGLPPGLYPPMPPGNGTIEVPIPVDLTAGKGKTKLNIGALLGALPAGSGRSVEVIGVEVWGPLGANAPDCLMIVGSGLPLNFGVEPPLDDCRGGTQIGISGVSIPE